MTERAQAFMNSIWEARNSGADTEEKLVASILCLAGDNIKSYTAQNGLIVLDRNDLLQLAEELNQ
jgi:hypothetical protein